MTEQPGLPDQFKELVAENEKRMKAIQDQIANQLEAQRKAVADLVESQQKAFAEFLEQQRGVKIADHWEAQRKAISEQIEHQRKAFTDLVERQWTAQKKAIEDAQHAIGGIFSHGSGMSLSWTSLSRTSLSLDPWSCPAEAWGCWFLPGFGLWAACTCWSIQRFL